MTRKGDAEIGRILIIDDDENLLRTYEFSLEKAGFKVAKAYDGRDALFKIRNERFSLVITDIKMPKLSGTELIDCLRERESDWSSRCPVIVSSGYIDDFVYTKYRNLGRIFFMPKPVALKDLLAKVSEALKLPVKRPQLDVKFVNPILAAVAKTVSEIAGVTLATGTPYLKKAGEISGDISCIVGVVSPGFRGNVSLSFDEAAFLRLVAKLTMIEFKEMNDEVRDAISQMLTMIFEEAKRDLLREGSEIHASIPSIITGKGHCVDHKYSSPAVAVRFSNPEFGECKVEICAVSGRVI